MNTKPLAERILFRLNARLYSLWRGLWMLFSKRSYLISSGLMHSFKAGKPCSPDGSPLPWMNYNVISFLEKRLHKSLTLFEYGCGYSTLFFAAHVGRVVSVEHDPGWFREIKQSMPANVELALMDAKPSDRYCRAVRDPGQEFDVVVIDGCRRTECVKYASEALTGRGVILLDDSQREENQDGAAFLCGKGFKQIDFEGLKPNGFANYRTSVFYRQNNCLGI